MRSNCASAITLNQEIAAVHAVRKRIGDTVALMVDYNQALLVEEALARELKVPIQIGKIFPYRKRWHPLEYVDWDDVLVQEPLAIVDGHAIVTQRPGHGMVWNSDAVERFRFH